MSTNSTDIYSNASVICDAFSSSSSSSSSSRDHGPCGACKFLRRKCLIGCIFAPYFDSEEGTVRFAAVHRVFGASNASKLLMRIPPQRRLEAVVTLCYEALARVRDPVYGCVAHIFSLQQQIVNLQAEIAYTRARISTLQQHTPLNPYGYSISSEMMTLFDISKSVEITDQEMTCFDIQEHEEADDDV